MKKHLPRQGLLCISLISLLFTSCPGPEGDKPYIPSGWITPELEYPKEDYTPSSVEIRPAPGQFIQNESFALTEENKDKLLGFPRGGGTGAADNSSVLSLGMAGGSVTFEFNEALQNYSTDESEQGYDFIIYGNAFFSGSSWNNEPAVVEVKNGDTWLLIPGSHLTDQDQAWEVEYSLNPSTGMLDFNATGGVSSSSVTMSGSRENSSDWWPDPSVDAMGFSGVYLLPADASSSFLGYGDCGPTMLLGDLNGDNDLQDPEDFPTVDPVYFYTDPTLGGGSPIDLDWAVDPETFELQYPESVQFVRLSSASLDTSLLLGDASPEIDALVRVLGHRIP